MCHIEGVGLGELPEGLGEPSLACTCGVDRVAVDIEVAAARPQSGVGRAYGEALRHTFGGVALRQYGHCCVPAAQLVVVGSECGIHAWLECPGLAQGCAHQLAGGQCGHLPSVGLAGGGGSLHSGIHVAVVVAVGHHKARGVAHHDVACIHIARHHNFAGIVAVGDRQALTVVVGAEARAGNAAHVLVGREGTHVVAVFDGGAAVAVDAAHDAKTAVGAVTRGDVAQVVAAHDGARAYAGKASHAVARRLNVAAVPAIGGCAREACSEAAGPVAAAQHVARVVATVDVDHLVDVAGKARCILYCYHIARVVATGHACGVALVALDVDEQASARVVGAGDVACVVAVDELCALLHLASHACNVVLTLEVYIVVAAYHHHRAGIPVHAGQDACGGIGSAGELALVAAIQYRVVAHGIGHDACHV